MVGSSQEVNKKGTYLSFQNLDEPNVIFYHSNSSMRGKMDDKLKKDKKELEEMTATETRGTEDSPPPQTITTYVAVPPDGGWGWVIVAASFVCNVIVDGIVFSFGVLLNDISEEFNISKPKCAIAGSLLSGFYLIAGPFVSAIANRYGFRFTGIAGSVFASFIFAISSLAPNIEYLWIVYGVLGGIGFGMIYVPAVITTGFYFEKWRALATGISVTGSGIGTIIMGPITKNLIDHFGWRGALLIQAGIILSCVIFSALYRPLKPIHVSVSNADAEETEEKRLPLLQRIKVARDQLRQADSTVSIENEVGITAVQPIDTDNKFLKANNNISYPTAAEVLHASAETLSKSQDSLKMKEYLMNKENLAKSNNKRISTELAIKIEKSNDDLKEYLPNDELLADHNNDDVFYTPKKLNRTVTEKAILGSEVRRDSITIKYRPRTTSESSYRSRKSTLTKVEAGVRPMYRDDIFFHASLNRLPQYQSHGSGLDYTMSVTRLPTWKDVQEEEEAKCQLCPEAVRRTLATMLDVSLLRSPTFMLFAWGGFFTMMGLFVPFMYLADRAVGNGMDPSMAVFLLSSIGITNTVGRIISGALSSVPGISALALNNIALTIGGIATMMSGLSDAPAYQFTFAAIFGLSISCFASLRSILVVDLIGLEKLTNAFGLLLLFQGIAAAIGSPIAGMFKELTNSYDATFYISGGLILLSGVMCYPLNYIKKWEDARAMKSDSECMNS